MRRRTSQPSRLLCAGHLQAGTVLAADSWKGQPGLGHVSQRLHLRGSWFQYPIIKATLKCISEFADLHGRCIRFAASRVACRRKSACSPGFVGLACNCTWTGSLLIWRAACLEGFSADAAPKMQAGVQAVLLKYGVYLLTNAI